MKAKKVYESLNEFERATSDSRYATLGRIGIGQKEVKRIMPVEVTDEEIKEAYKLLAEGTDPNWDESELGALYIGVTGKHRVYYTFWKYSPRSMQGAIYLGNLAMDLLDAVKKAKSKAGVQPVHIESQDTLTSLKGTPPEVITWGKHRGKTIGEVYGEDPQYVIWLSKNMQPRNKKQVKQLELAKELTNDFFKSMADKRRSSETKDYFGQVGDIFEGSVKVTKINLFDSEYGESYRVRAENDDYRFEFYIKSNIFRRYFESSPDEAIGKTLDISGKVKGAREVLGLKYTMLNYVKINSINEGLDFERGQAPMKSMNLGREAILIKALENIAKRTGLWKVERPDYKYRSPYKYTRIEWGDNHSNELSLLSGEDGTGYELFVINHSNESGKWEGEDDIWAAINSGEIERYFVF